MQLSIKHAFTNYIVLWSGQTMWCDVGEDKSDTVLTAKIITMRNNTFCFRRYIRLLKKIRSNTFCSRRLYLGHCVVCSSSIYGFWLPLWYLQTLHIKVHNPESITMFLFFEAAPLRTASPLIVLDQIITQHVIRYGQCYLQANREPVESRNGHMW
jgi:hypothetical protein